MCYMRWRRLASQLQPGEHHLARCKHRARYCTAHTAWHKRPDRLIARGTRHAAGACRYLGGGVRDAQVGGRQSPAAAE